MEISVEKAKEVLTQAGYFVENLWSVRDVNCGECEDCQNGEYCNAICDEDKLDILGHAVCRDQVFERINDAIAEEVREFMEEE